MRKPDTWKSIGDIARSLAARLVAAREEFEKATTATTNTVTAAEGTAPLAAEKGGAPVGRSLGDRGAPSKPAQGRPFGLLFSIEKVGGCIPAQADLRGACGKASLEIAV